MAIRRFWKGLAALVLVAGAASAQGPRKGPELRFAVSAQDARCVLRNRSAYLKSGVDPAVLFLKLCPSVTPTPAQVARLNQASGGLTIVERKVQGVPVRSVVVLTKQQMDCFLSDLRRGAGRARKFVVVDLGDCR